uniref:RNA-dependent RNA polymerase n=1 Tax=Setaria italica TaxID=4555 RepID=K3Y2C1_SETIT
MTLSGRVALHSILFVSTQMPYYHGNMKFSGKVLVYKHPGLHFGDIHKLTATHIDGLQEIVGDSKYDIFFPTSGSRSLADEMANSDFDGDMYWVSWNSQKKPQDYDGSKLESLLVSEFLRARFSPSYVLGTSANCWLTLMDRLLTPGVSQSEKDLIKINMLELVDIYYWALDAPKNGNKKYPHFLEREPSYHSTSLLGEIYDQAKSQQSETAPPINNFERSRVSFISVRCSLVALQLREWVFGSDVRLRLTSRLDDFSRLRIFRPRISPLKCFTEKVVSKDYKHRWTDLYRKYLKESSSLSEFEASLRSRSDLFDEACAICQVVGKCGFASKVAGRALCELYVLKHGGERVTCLRSVLEDAFKKNRAGQARRDVGE